MPDDHDYVVGRLPGRKRPALYRITTEPDGGAWIQPLAYFRDDDDLLQFVRDTIAGQLVLVAGDLVREAAEEATDARR